MDTPWGFRATSRGLVCTTTHAERQARAALGEFAIGLFDRLGVSPERLAEINAAPDALAALRGLTGKGEGNDVHGDGDGSGGGAGDQRVATEE
jgi:hypothetical protein